MASSKVGRNDPCPCGSGKKYKRCCLERASGGKAGYTSADRVSARARMNEFASRDEHIDLACDAEDIFWGPFADDLDELDARGLMEQGESVFESWLWFDHRLPDGRRLVDRFLATEPALTREERRYLEAMRPLAMRPYEVEAVVPGESLTLSDALTGARTTCRELLGSRCLRRWDVVAARLAPVGASGHPEIEDLLPLPRGALEKLTRTLREDLATWREREPARSELEFFEHNAPLFHQLWVQASFGPSVPTVVMPDGEQALITRVRFAVANRETVLAALDRARDMAREDEAPIWQWRPQRRERDEPPVTIELRGETLVAMALTRGSAERAQRRIERLLGDAVRRGLVTHQDLGQAMREVEAQPRPAEPFEGADDLALEHYARHYALWIHQPVPALDGETPRDAARSPAMRPRLVAMLKDLENMYCRSLSLGQVGYDASWMWEELGLDDAPEAPPRRTHPPPLAHESMARHLRRFAEVAGQLSARVRRRPDFDVDTVITPDDLMNDVTVRRFLTEHARRACASGLSEENANRDAAMVATHLGYASNHELHRRKTFWVDEGLAWMLGHTNLDIVGDALRPPFTSFALVFTDRDTLALAERLLSKEEACTHRGRLLQALTVYATQLTVDGKRTLLLWFLFDDLSADWPYMVSRDLVIDPDAHLEQILDSHLPDVDPDSRDPIFTAPVFKLLVQRALNAILYATSAGAEAEPRSPSPPRRRAGADGAPVEHSSESVFHLPGHIDIRQLRRLQGLERAPGGRALAHRFLVRGHWRRPNPSWKEQHLRWIKPHWKGPDIAAVIERSYRLRAPERDDESDGGEHG